MTVLAAYRQIWRATLQTLPRLTGWLLGFLIAGALVVALVAAWDVRVALRAAPRILAGIGAFWGGWAWLQFLGTSLRLNAGANGRLVPRQRRRFQEILGGGWLVVAACAGIAAHSWAGVVVAGMSLLACVLTATLVRYCFLLAPVWLIVGQTQWARNLKLLGPVEHVFGNGPVQLALLAIEVALGAWTLRQLYPAAGRALSDAPQPAVASGARGLVRYGARLQADCRAADAGALLLHALGPAARWTVQAPGVLTLMAWSVGARLWGHWGGTTDGYDAIAGLGLAGMVAMLALGPAGLRSGLSARRGEQGLVRLTPLAGDAARMNALLAGQLLRQALLVLAPLVAMALLALALLGAAGTSVASELALCCLAAQAGLTRFLDDVASERRLGAGRWSRALVLAVLESVAAAAAARFTHTSAWWWLAGIAIAFTVWGVRRDWRRMLGAPPAYPAGRLA